MWRVSSRSGVATLRTAIHLLLTYLLPFSFLFPFPPSNVNVNKPELVESYFLPAYIDEYYARPFLPHIELPIFFDQRSKRCKMHMSSNYQATFYNKIINRR